MQRKESKKIALSKSSIYSSLAREKQLADSAIRVMAAQRLRSIPEVNINQVTTLGQHAIAEFCLKQPLLDQGKGITLNYLERVMRYAALKANAHVLNIHSLQKGTGNDLRISCAVVIAESHLVFHYFAKHNYLAVDIYTCGNMDTGLSLDVLIKELGLSPYDQVNFKRGIRAKADTELDPLAKKQPHFIPGLAVPNKKNLRFFNKQLNYFNSIAEHCVGEFYCCDSFLINNGASLKNIVREAFNTEFEEVYIKEFKPQGVSLFAFTAEGDHIAMHPWPELEPENYLPLDVFVSSTSKINVKKGLQHFAGLIKSQHYTVNEFPRGIKNAAGQFIPVLQQKILLEDKDNNHTLQY